MSSRLVLGCTLEFVRTVRMHVRSVLRIVRVATSIQELAGKLAVAASMYAYMEAT